MNDLEKQAEGLVIKIQWPILIALGVGVVIIALSVIGFVALLGLVTK